MGGWGRWRVGERGDRQTDREGDRVQTEQAIGLECFDCPRNRQEGYRMVSALERATCWPDVLSR
jgi:hypothetical protein